MSFEKEVPIEVAQNLILKLIECKENNICVDCGHQATTHCSIPHGTFICSTCANIHYSLPFFPIKPVVSDNWSLRELKLLVSGGNPAFIEFCSYYSLQNAPIEIKYRSKAAYFYREVLNTLAFGGCYEGDYPSIPEGTEIFEEIELGDLSEDSTLHSMLENPSKWSWFKQVYKSYPEVHKKSLQVVDKSMKKILQMTRVDNLVINARRSLSQFTIGRVTDEMQKILNDVEKYVLKSGEYLTIITSCTNPKRTLQPE